MRLQNFEFKETLSGVLESYIVSSTLGQFNLIVGDNAKGKTRFFNTLRFIRNLHNNNFGLPNPNLLTYFHLGFVDINDSGASTKIDYEVNITRTQQGVQFYDEILSNNDKLIFSRKDNYLYLETENKIINEPYIPPTVLMCSAVPDQPTMKKINSFFNRMLFLDANRASVTQFNPDFGNPIINDTGSNLFTVIENWEQNNHTALHEALFDFQNCFDFVEKDSLVLQYPNNLIKNAFNTKILFMHEKGIAKEIPIFHWSEGMHRTLVLFVLLATRFNVGDDTRPSMICVDEIENGLDSKTINAVLSAYRNHSEIIQMLISSHSLLAYNMIPFSDWRIARRKGTEFTLQSPVEIDPGIEKKRDNLLNSNWEFYLHSIASPDNSE